MRELIHAGQAWDLEAEEFKFTIVIWKENDQFYYVHHPHRKYDLESLEGPTLMHPEDMWAPWHPGLTEAPTPLPADSYVKTQSLVSLAMDSEDTVYLSSLLLAEAEVYEVLKAKPHPNICVYYGGVRQGDHLTGLCLQRYKCTLGDAVAKAQPFDRIQALDDIVRGVEFLHSLGFAHNDINPRNIMFDGNGTAVLVDFDSCMRVGKRLLNGQTPNWSLPSAVSARENDLHGIELITKFLNGEDPDRPGFEMAPRVGTLEKSTTLGILILGATGYIGGGVLSAVLAAYPRLVVTALVREPHEIETVQALGANAIQVSLEDLPKISEIAAQSDIVLNAADDIDLSLTKAIIEAMKFRARSAKTKPILIHTSSTDSVATDVECETSKPSKEIWNDDLEEDVLAISSELPCKSINLIIHQADREGQISAYIIAPSTVYGVSSGPMGKASPQITALVQAALKHRQAVYVGKDLTNKGMNVHIDDLVELYLLVLARAMSGTDDSPPCAKFYSGSAYEHTWVDTVSQMGNILYAKGLLHDGKAKSVPMNEEPGLARMTHGLRIAAGRGREVGWTPTAKYLGESLKDDIDMVLAMLKEG